MNVTQSEMSKVIPKINLSKRIRITKQYVNGDLVEVPERAVRKMVRRSIDFIYDEFCEYCANNDICLDGVTDKQFNKCVEIIENFVIESSRDYSCEIIYYWID